MRRLSALFGLIVATSSVYGQGDAGYVSERVKEFGTVPRGPLLIHYFAISNPTKQTLVIGNVRVSCGCTSASALKTQLAPGESSAIYAQMDTRRFFGSKAVTIYVQIVQPILTELALQVRAYSRDDFAIYPDTLNFGAIKHGAEPSQSVKVHFYGDAGLKVTEAVCGSSFVQPSVKPVSSQGGEVVFEISAKLHKDLPVGRWFTDIWITTSNPTMGRIRIPLSVQVDASGSTPPASSTTN